MAYATNEQHVASKGEKCPCCGCTDFSGGHVTIGNGCALQEVTCVTCDASWTDTYHLVSYELVEEPRTEDVEEEAEVAGDA